MKATLEDFKAALNVKDVRERAKAVMRLRLANVPELLGSVRNTPQYQELLEWCAQNVTNRVEFDALHDEAFSEDDGRYK